jgi:hypothetical protein
MPNSAEMFWGLSGADKGLHCLALSALAGASLALIALPAHKLSPSSAGLQGQSERHGSGTLKRAIYIGHVVERISRRCFWKPVCLPQAIATAWILKGESISFSVLLGVKKSPPGLEAHAWVEVENTIVIGGANHHEYRLIGPLNQEDYSDPVGNQP